MRFKVTSRKLQILRFVLIVMSSPCFLNSRVMSFLVRSDCGPLVFRKSTSPSSLWSPTLFLPYLSLRMFSIKSPISSQTSAPSKLPMVTSNMLFWSFFVQAVSLSNKRDLRQCIMMSVSLSLIVTYFLAKEMALESKDSVIDG